MDACPTPSPSLLQAPLLWVPIAFYLGMHHVINMDLYADSHFTVNIMKLKVGTQYCLPLAPQHRLRYTVVAVVQLLGHVQHFVTPWTVACQASLSPTISQSYLQVYSRCSINICWSRKSLVGSEGGSGTCSEGRGLGLELGSGWGRGLAPDTSSGNCEVIPATPSLCELRFWSRSQRTLEVTPLHSALNCQPPTCHPYLSILWDVSLRTFASGRGTQIHSSLKRGVKRALSRTKSLQGLGGTHTFAEQLWREGDQSPAFSACSSIDGCVILGQALPSL